MRRGDVRRGRQCLRPEVCRTYNFGERGSSAGQFYYRYLVPIRLNTVDVLWAKKVGSVPVPEAHRPLDFESIQQFQHAGACLIAAEHLPTLRTKLARASYFRSVSSCPKFVCSTPQHSALP
jgi:GNT-I family